MAVSNLHIHIDKEEPLSLFRQIYEKIRDDILSKNLVPGTRLPATRNLSKDLGVSRNVVIEAYDQLQAEGYIESKQGAYTQVAPDTYYRKYRGPRKTVTSSTEKWAGHEIYFKTGMPDLKDYRRVLWGKYLKQAAVEAREDELAYYAPEGLKAFRRVLADYLYRSRGIQVQPQNIVVTSGA
ncbi:MAG: GntR family transcriptional regulator, partial [Bacteroidales bacterium]|nr:GntR family transcriptional regulator [Bacteroidales bacterium]